MATELHAADRFDAAATFSFYAALHFANARIAEKGTHSSVSMHHQRSALMANDDVLKACYRVYANLQEISEDARYGVHPLTPQHSTRAIELRESVKATVRSYLERRLRQDWIR